MCATWGTAISCDSFWLWIAFFFSFVRFIFLSPSQSNELLLQNVFALAHPFILLLLSSLSSTFFYSKHTTSWNGKWHNDVETVIKIYMPIWRRQQRQGRWQQWRCTLTRKMLKECAVSTCFMFHTPYILNCTNSISFPFILFSSIVNVVGYIF